jgi:hypothetical protein
MRKVTNGPEVRSEISMACCLVLEFWSLSSVSLRHWVEYLRLCITSFAVAVNPPWDRNQSTKEPPALTSYLTSAHNGELLTTPTASNLTSRAKASPPKHTFRCINDYKHSPRWYDIFETFQREETDPAISWLDQMRGQ